VQCVKMVLYNIWLKAEKKHVSDSNSVVIIRIGCNKNCFRTKFRLISSHFETRLSPY
jgi:hypothetical protein